MNEATVNLKTDLKQKLEVKNAEIRRLNANYAKYVSMVKAGSLASSLEASSSRPASTAGDHALVFTYLFGCMVYTSHWFL